MQEVVVDDLFNIENTKDYILSIQVSLGGFSFTIFSTDENRLLYYRNILLTITNQNFLHLRFKELAENEEILQRKFKEVKVIFDTKEFLPVPDKYYEEQEKEKLAGSVLEIENEIEIIANKISSKNIWLLFTIPKLLKSYLSEHFATLEIVHPLQKSIENLPQLAPGKSGLILLFSSKHFYTVLFNEQKLLLANSFELKHKNDILFFTLSVLKQFKVTSSKADLFLTGNILDGETTIEEIKKYFTSSRLLKPSIDVQINNNIFKEPEYKLYNLLNSVS